MFCFFLFLNIFIYLAFQNRSTLCFSLFYFILVDSLLFIDEHHCNLKKKKQSHANCSEY